VFDEYSESHEMKFLIKDQKKRFLQQFPNKDNQIEKTKKEVRSQIESGKKFTLQEEEALLDKLDELDLFAFTPYEQEDGTSTNILIEALKVGLTGVLDYAFNDGFINIRAVLKRNNVFEIENEVALFNVGFFSEHFNNLNYLKKLYYYFIDFMQLSNFLELFDYALDPEIPETIKQSIFDFVLTDARFKSLFLLSMEFQKYIFINEMLGISE
jgi:hypothetical protein